MLQSNLMSRYSYSFIFDSSEICLIWLKLACFFFVSSILGCLANYLRIQITTFRAMCSNYKFYHYLFFVVPAMAQCVLRNIYIQCEWVVCVSMIANYTVFNLNFWLIKFMFVCSFIRRISEYCLALSYSFIMKIAFESDSCALW